MTGADIYYRAYRAFRRSSLDGYTREREKIKESVSLIADASDLCEYSFFDCRIEKDWVEAIEEGLEHIEKTIEAQRRFIKYEGDTVRIEKAKRTTVESVKHLSKHSNLIKEERGDSVLPEKLYVVENEENFAVYENRFIYMLLTMLNDFVSVRYSAVTDAKSRARYTFFAKRNITAAGRKISFDVSFDEYSTRLDTEDSAKEDPIYARVGVILARIVEFLDTPLMKTVSQAPMLKPPIVRTNVLKMNPHFFAAYELYTYILAYTGNGYEITENKESVSVFDDRTCELLCDSILFQANIAYMGSERMKRFLEASYNAREAELAAKEEKERDERLASLRRKLDSGEIDAAGYIGALEEAIEEIKSSLSDTRDELSAIGENYEKLQRAYELSGEECEELKRQNHSLELKIEENENQFRASVHEIRAEYTEAMVAREREFDAERKALEEYIKEKDTEIENLHAEYKKREEELMTEFDARLRACRLANGEGTDEDNSASRDEFVRLEREKKAFDEYYKRQWASAKKNIRKALLWSKGNEAPTRVTEETADTDKENLQ